MTLNKNLHNIAKIVKFNFQDIIVISAIFGMIKKIKILITAINVECAELAKKKTISIVRNVMFVIINYTLISINALKM